MKNSSKTDRGVRILGRQVGKVLNLDELKLVSGGPFSENAIATDSHTGTCTSEQDCD